MSEKTTSSPQMRFPGPGGPGRMPGTMQVEYAENIRGTLLRIAAYFTREKGTLAAMLCVVVFGTLCGIAAPGLQSAAIDTLSGVKSGELLPTAGLMLCCYLHYSASHLAQ